MQAATFFMTNVEGEVMVNLGKSGWIKGIEGMAFPPDSIVTVQTGTTGSCTLLNGLGRHTAIEPNSLFVVHTSKIARDPDPSQ